jgi:hypothetical protein
MATYSVPKGTFNHATLLPLDPCSYYSDKVRTQSKKRYRVWVCSNSRGISAEVAGTYRAMGRKGLVM